MNIEGPMFCFSDDRFLCFFVLENSADPDEMQHYKSVTYDPSKCIVDHT